MKKILTLFTVLLISVFAWAQSPKLSYQAVVRDSQNKLVVEQPVTVTVNVLDAANASQFTQTLNATTNRNGLMSLEIGDETDGWKNLNWAGAKIRTSVAFDGTVLVDTTIVNAVPSALYANRVALDAIPQSDWAETDNTQCTFILNKPNISDTVNYILNNGQYVTAAALDAHGYLTSDSAVITTMQNNIAANTTNIATNASNITDAIAKEKADSATLAARIDALEGSGSSMTCPEVKTCISDTLDAYTTTTALMTILNKLNAKIDSLGHIVDSLTTFHCGKNKVSDIDGNQYKTVKIGNQCWMAQNLRCTTSPKGNTLTLASGVASTSTSYYYKNEAFGNEGYLYNWRAAIDTNIDVSTLDNTVTIANRRGLCPEGWHLPTMEELTTLCSNYNAGQLSAPNNSYTGTVWEGSTDCADNYPKCLNDPDKNISGFSAIPVGYTREGTPSDAGTYAQFWSSTITNGTYSKAKFINYEMVGADNTSSKKEVGCSIRCLKD